MTAPRQAPIEFVETYLQNGWDGLQYIFRTHNSTLKRWIEQNGGDELRARRAAIVAEKRRARAYVSGRVAPPVSDGIKVHVQIVTAAAQHLRLPRNGGWVVSATGKGDWRIGSMRKSPAGLVEFASAKGFDPSVIVITEQG